MMSEIDSSFRRYDRQIRIWGLEAQKKISLGRAVVVGAWSSTGNEVIKNLVLTGLSALYLLQEEIPNDGLVNCGFFSGPSGPLDYYTNFLDRVCPLNPSVLINTIESVDLISSLHPQINAIVYCRPLTAILDSVEEFQRVCELNGIARSIENCGFFIASAAGPIGVIFSDAGPQYKYLESSSSVSGAHEKNYKEFSEAFTFAKFRSIFDQRKLQENRGYLNAISSVIGGALTQDILKFIGRNGFSTPGLYLFDGSDFSSKLFE